MKMKPEYYDLKEISGIYRDITKVIILEKSYRQTGSDGKEETEFLEFLYRLRQGECTEDDVENIRRRRVSVLKEEDRKILDETLHAYPMRWMVREQNR